MVEAMKQYFFVKTMATDLHITVSQRGEPIGVLLPDMDAYADLAEWSVEIKVETGLPLLYMQVLMPPTASESDVMTMVDTVIGIEFTKGMIAVRKFEIAEEGDF